MNPTRPTRVQEAQASHILLPSTSYSLPFSSCLLSFALNASLFLLWFFYPHLYHIHKMAKASWQSTQDTWQSCAYSYLVIRQQIFINVKLLYAYIRVFSGRKKKNKVFHSHVNTGAAIFSRTDCLRFCVLRQLARSLSYFRQPYVTFNL